MLIRLHISERLEDLTQKIACLCQSVEGRMQLHIHGHATTQAGSTTYHTEDVF
jgi:hypothetical protein